MKIKVANNLEDINTCYDLREIIFIKGQNVPIDRERDEYDNICTHFLLIDNNKPIGVARIRKNSEYIIIERVGILQEYRKNGAGFFLMQGIIDYCKNNNFSKIVLSSQEHAVNFYNKFGFKTIGEKYMDANIPHLKMQLILPLF